MSGNAFDSRPAPTVRWAGLLPWCIGCGVVVALLVFVGGCGRSSDPANPSKPNGRVEDDALGRGKDLLDVAIGMVQPDRLGINALPEQAAGMLNQWRSVQLESAEKERLSEPLSEEVRTFLKKQFSDESLQQTERDDYTQQDAKHIRTAMLMKDIVSHAVRGVDGELNRAQVLFEYVARNVQLTKDENALPLMPYEILIFGEGTAEDRAWVFAELLRQLNQDAVIVKPADAESSSPWFVGVIAGNEIRLFDPLRSTPVPSGPQGDRQDLLPATPADLSKQSVLDALEGDSPAEGSLTPQQFEKLRIELIGTSALWAPRNARLEKVLTGSNSVVISQKLVAEGNDSSAILNRIRSLGGEKWRAEGVRPWDYAESRFQAYEESTALDERWEPFQAPTSIMIAEGTGEVMIGNSTKGQLRTRTRQLRGDCQDAIRQYQRIRLAYLNLPSGVSSDIRSMHADAAEDAFFWSAVCQMEQDTPEDAVDKLSSYIKQSEQFSKSRHADHARVLLARSLAKVGRTSDALNALKPLKPNSPEYAAAMFLKRSLAAAPSQESTSSEPAPPANPKPNPNPQPEPKPNQPAVAEKPGA